MASVSFVKRMEKAFSHKKWWGGVLGLTLFGMILSSCANVGREFPESRVAEIQIGKTTQAQVREMFGPPWRVGIEDGLATWTYGKYHYRIVGETNSKDLVVRFDAKNVVVSYSFNTTDHKK